MSGDACDEMHLLIQADVDGELGPAEAARVRAHLDRCADCEAVQQGLLSLSERVRRDVAYRPAPEALIAAVRSRVAAAAVSPEMAPVTTPAPRRRPGWIAPFGGGFALAACLALAVVLPGGGGRGLPDAVVAGHIRALQPGHLMDVVSTDQHTVKPWFDGRLDFAPPVKDLKGGGFPLVGGRLDYVAGRPVAALVYQRRQHVIDLFVWPDGGHVGRGPADSRRDGYNVLRWSWDGMAFWAVSDLSPQELADFVRLWQANP